MTTVSVLVPVYDTCAEILDQALASVQEQSYETDHIQVCIHDDGSADRYRAGYERLDLRQYDFEVAWSGTACNRGLSAARNAAASNADGELYVLLDSDDVLAPGAIAAVVDAFDRSPAADVVYSDNVKFTWPDVDLYQYRKKRAYQRWMTRFEGTAFDPLFQASFVVGLLAMRADTFAALGGYDEDVEVGEDVDFLVRAHGLDDGNNFVHVPRVLYFRRHSETSLSRSRQDELRENTEAAMLRAARERGLDVADARHFGRLRPYEVSHYLLCTEDGEPIVPPYVNPSERRLEGVPDTEESLEAEWESDLGPRLEAVLS